MLIKRYFDVIGVNMRDKTNGSLNFPCTLSRKRCDAELDLPAYVPPLVLL